MPDTRAYSTPEKLASTVIDETPQTVLVRFPDGNVESISKDSVDGVLCGVEGVEVSVPIVARGQALYDKDRLDEFGATGMGVEFRLELDTGKSTLSVGEGLDDVEVSGEQFATILTTITPFLEDDDVHQNKIELDTVDANRLLDIYTTEMNNRVRKDVIVDILNRTRGPMDYDFTIDEDNGIVVADTYIITWDAENYLVEYPGSTVYKRSGKSVQAIEEVPQAFGFTFDFSDLDVFTIDNEEYVLNDREQKLLATTWSLLRPSDSFGVKTFAEEAVDQAYLAMSGDDNIPIRDELTNSMGCEHFVDHKTGLLHKHEPGKHIVADSFNVTRGVVLDLHYNSWDHAGVAELAWREKEFRNADKPVFTDTDNDDDTRWNRIQATAKDAPCPPIVYETLTAMYGQQSSE